MKYFDHIGKWLPFPDRRRG